MKFGFYVSKNATRYIEALKDNILNKSNTAFALVDFLDVPNLIQMSKKYDIPLYRYSYEEKKLIGKYKNEFISNAFLRLLKKYDCDYAFIIGGRLLLQGDILNEFYRKIINFHPSILPSYKGEFNAIDKGLKDYAILLGNTAHFINEKADDGITIMQSIIPTRKFTDYDSVLDLQLPMLKQIISWLEQNRFVFDDNGKFYVKNAAYEIGQFIPNLENICVNNFKKSLV